MALKPEPWLAEVLNRSILVTGAPRSGTTLLGNLLHSCEGVEYVFEPKTVLPLLALMDSLDEANWRVLFETTLVAEAMMDRVAGRTMNFNTFDDTYFGRVKVMRDEKNARLGHSWSAAEAQGVCAQRVLVWKSPEAGIWAKDLKRLYPGMRVVAIWRSQNEVVRSMMVKGWFAGSKEARWFHQDGDMPFWWHRRRGEGWRKCWIDLDERQKAATLWSSVWGGLGEGIYVVLYSALCGKPQEVFSSLCAFLGLAPGPMTPGLLSVVRRRFNDATK